MNVRPQDHQDWRQWWQQLRNFYSLHRVIAITVPILVVCVLGSSLYVWAATQPPRINRPSPVVGSPTPVASLSVTTASPTSTNTPVLRASPSPQRAQPIVAAVLGGTPAAFAAKYGAPIDGGSSYQFVVNGITIQAILLLQTGTDGQLHAYTMQIHPPGSSTVWSAAQATAIYQTLVPPDAVLVRTIQTSSGPGWVYHSDAFAATFPASMFTTVGANPPVTPGGFAVQCFPPAPGAQGIYKCYLGISALLASP